MTKSPLVFAKSREEDGSKTRSRDRRRTSIFILIWSCLVALSISLWNPFRIKQVNLPTLGALFNGAKDSNDKPPIIQGLAPFELEPLPLGSIRPEGWIFDQMQLMAQGSAGHQFDFYHIVKSSPWLGGRTSYSGLHEGLPYWLNGLVPLAYGLDDPRLKAQVLQAAEEVLDRQAKDGWLGPEIGSARDIWARFPLCLGFKQLVEAEPSLTNRVVPALYKFVRLMHKLLKRGTAYKTSWGTVRYPDMLVTLQWLYENHPRNNTELLLDTMRLLYRQGFDWPGYWTKSKFIFADLDTIKPAIEWENYKFRHSHAVNVGQGLSAGAAIYRFTKNESLLDVNRDGVNWTFSYHGDVAGSIIGDERESGLGPNRGSELCTASETLYSLSYLYHVIGDNDFADRCELAAFNAWPVSITADHWSRQYIAVANSPSAGRIYGHSNFWNVGYEGLVYGFDTNYPCCTVNMPQGLPKYLSASFVRIGIDGVGHALLGPASVSTTTKSGISVNVTCQTHYPFGPFLNYTIQSSAMFTFYIRIPSWAEPASPINIEGSDDTIEAITNPHSGMAAVTLGPGRSAIWIQLKTDIRVVPRGNSSVAVYHGALLYALDVGQEESLYANTLQPNITYNRFDGPIEFPVSVKNVEMSNTKAWNIGIDPSTLEFHTDVNSNGALADPIFEYHAPPGYITGKGCPIHWPLKNGLPAALQALPHGQCTHNCSGNMTDVLLRPYASLKVHMAELPVVDLRLAEVGHGS